MHLLSHSPSTRQGELFHLSCLFPSWQQVLFYKFNDWILLCNQYLSCLLWFWSLWGVLIGCVCCYLLVPLLLIILNHPLFSLELCRVIFLLLSFFFFGMYVFLLLFFFFASSCFFSFSCVSFSSSHMLFHFFLPFFPSSLRVSRLIVLAVVLFSPYFSSFLSCVSSSPQAPRVHLKRKMETTSISFCLPFGSFARCLSKINFLFCLWWMSFIHRTCYCWMLLEMV